MDDTAFQAQTPKKSQTTHNDSVLESLRTLGSGVGKTVAKDVTGRVASDALASLLGQDSNQGEVRPDRSIDFQKERGAWGRRPEMQTRAPYVEQTELHLKEQIEAVRSELKALASSIKSLNTDIQRSIAETPVDPGVYHKNFFERLRSILMTLREQVDDSRTWLSLSNTRKQKRGYWGMYKKHGTTFGLSNERTLATQAG
jgi:hypothetical protein